MPKQWGDHTAPWAACCWQISEVTTQTLGHPSSLRATTWNSNEMQIMIRKTRVSKISSKTSSMVFQKKKYDDQNGKLKQPANSKLYSRFKNKSVQVVSHSNCSSNWKSDTMESIIWHRQEWRTSKIWVYYKLKSPYISFLDKHYMAETLASQQNASCWFTFFIRICALPIRVAETHA